MIARIWHGYTKLEQSKSYEDLLRKEVFAGIKKMNIPGYKGIQLLKRNLGHEIEFVTIMWFDDLDSVKAFVGEEYARAYVPEEARKLLSRFDKESRHYTWINAGKN